MRLKKTILALCTAAALFFHSVESEASQASCIMPTVGTVTGLTLVNDINSCNGSLISVWSGNSAPSGAVNGMFWFNTTTNYIQQFDGSTWNNLWFVDASLHLTTPTIGGGSVSATVNSGATTDLGSVPQSFVTVLVAGGPITSFGSSASVGSVKIVKFAGSNTLTYNATSLILPAGQTITTQAGDTLLALYLGGGNWQVINYTAATGAALFNPAVPLGSVFFGDFATLPTKFVYGNGQALTRTSFPQYVAAVTRAQAGTLTSGNATISGVSNTAGFGAGMPVEGSVGINAGCTIASVVANTSITLNSNSCVTANGASTITVFITGYGSGGSGSTVGVRDCRGRVIAGRDDLGGTAANVLTSTFFGTSATAIGAIGGSQSHLLLTGEIPSHTHANSLTDPGHTHGLTFVNVPVVLTAAGGSENFGTGGNSHTGLSGVMSVNSASTGMTITNAAQGGGGAHSIVQPTSIADCIVAVLP